jgi:CspA family cold shock protein
MFMINTENQNQNMHAVTSEFETVGMGLRELKENLPEMGREGCAAKPLPTTEEVPSSNRCRGIVKWFNPTKGFGFITPSSGGIDVFVHQSEIQLSGFRSLAQGEPVEYELYDGEKGPKALQVTGPDGSQVKGAPREVKPKVETKSSKTSDNTQVPVPKYIKVGNNFIQVTSNTQVPVSTSVLAPTPITSAIPMYSSPTPATQFSQYILTNTGVPQSNFYQEIPMEMRAMPMSPTPMMIDQSHMTTMSPQYYPMAHPMGMSPTPMSMTPTPQMTQLGMSPSTPTPQFAFPGQNFTQHTMQSPMQINTMQSGMNSPQIDYTQLNSENPFEQTNSFFAQEYNPMGMEIASPMSPHHC